MIQYTIVIRCDDDENKDEANDAKELMAKLTDLVNDHTSFQAECYVHDTSLPVGNIPQPGEEYEP